MHVPLTVTGSIQRRLALNDDLDKAFQDLEDFRFKRSWLLRAVGEDPLACVVVPVSCPVGVQPVDVALFGQHVRS